MLCGSLGLAARTEELAEPDVRIGQVGEHVEQPVAHALGFVELASVDEIDGVVGHLLEPLVVVVVGIWHRARDGGVNRDSGCRNAAPLMLACGRRGGFVGGQATVLVSLATAAGTGWLRPTLAMDPRCPS